MSLIRQTSSLAPVRYKSEPWNYLPTIPLERAYSTVGARLMESSIDMAVSYILSSWTSWFRLSMGSCKKKICLRVLFEWSLPLEGGFYLKLLSIKEMWLDFNSLEKISC